jgi:predicted ArsR family transcriptional regulator
MAPAHLEQAETVGDLTVNDRETLRLVLQAGGTVTAAELAEQLGIEQTTAGNRLVALNKKGYLLRVERPHPVGHQFFDVRSVDLEVRK